MEPPAIHVGPSDVVPSGTNSGKNQAARWQLARTGRWDLMGRLERVGGLVVDDQVAVEVEVSVGM